MAFADNAMQCRRNTLTENISHLDNRTKWKKYIQFIFKQNTSEGHL